MKRILEKNYIVKQNFEVESLDYAKAKQQIRNMQSLEKTLRECTLIFDYYKHSYAYIKSYNEYFNNIPQQIKSPYVLFNKQLHPRFDLGFIKQLHHRAFQYAFTLPIRQRKDLFMQYRCRMKTQAGIFQMTDVKLRLLETDNKGNIWLVLFLIEQAKDDNYTVPYIEIYDKTVAEKYELNPQICNHLSEAEIEIAHAIFETSNNSEISKNIGKSVNTVRKHLNSIYIKTQAEDKTHLQQVLLSGGTLW